MDEIKRVFFLLPFVFFCVNGTVNQMETVRIQSYNGSAGVVFIPQGNVVFTETSWQLVLSLNISSIQTNVKELGKALHNLEKDAGHNMDERMVNKLKMQFKHLKEHLEQLISEINNPKPTARKRSWNPFDWVTGSFGSIARRLFGVASEEEVKKLESYMAVLYKREEKIATMQSLHVTALKVIEGQMVQQQHQLSILTNVTKLLVETIAPPKSKRKDLTSNILVVYGELENVIQNLADLLRTMTQIIRSLDGGVLMTSLVPPKVLQEAVRHIRDQLPYDSSLIFLTTDAGIHQYYRNPLMSRLPGKEEIRALLRIPLKLKSDTYTWYKATPFPRTIQTTNQTDRLEVVTMETDIALSKDHKNYLELREWVPQLECLPGPPRICPIHTAVIDNPKDICLFNLIRGHPLYDSRCSLKRVEDHEIRIEKLDEITWIVSTFSNLTAESRCVDLSNPSLPMNSKSYQIEQGEHMLQVQRHCLLKVGSYHVPLRLRITSGLDLTGLMDWDSTNVQGKLEPLRIPQDNLENRVWERALMQLTSLQENLSNRHEERRINDIVKQIISVKDEMMNIKPLWVSHYSSIGLFGFMLILSVCFLIVWCKCLKPIWQEYQKPGPRSFAPRSVVFRTVAPETVEMIQGPTPRRDPIYELP